MGAAATAAVIAPPKVVHMLYAESATLARQNALQTSH